jgi:hypothetical protein
VDEKRSEDPLVLWTVYDKPRDFPRCFVARKFEITTKGHRPTGMFLIGPDLDQLRQYLEHMGLSRIDRNEGDEPHIVECWL